MTLDENIANDTPVSHGPDDTPDAAEALARVREELAAVMEVAEHRRVRINGLESDLATIADALLESATLLGNVADVFAAKCVDGIVADEARARAYAERTSALATALNPLIGYERAAAIVHTALDSGRSIIDVVVDEGVLPADEARRVLDPLRAAGRRPGEV